MKKGRGPFVRRDEIAAIVADLSRSGVEVSTESLRDGEAWIRNDTGSDLEAYSVVKLGNSIKTPGNNEAGYKYGDPAFVGEEIDEDDTEVFAVVQKPLANGKIARAVMSGATRVRLVGEADKTHATTKEGADTLEAADSGPCVILYDPGPGDSERIAWVRIGGGGGGDPLTEALAVSGACYCRVCLRYGGVREDEYPEIYVISGLSTPGSFIRFNVRAEYNSDEDRWESDTFRYHFIDETTSKDACLWLEVDSTGIEGAKITLFEVDENDDLIARQEWRNSVPFVPLCGAKFHRINRSRECELCVSAYGSYYDCGNLKLRKAYTIYAEDPPQLISFEPIAPLLSNEAKVFSEFYESFIEAANQVYSYYFGTPQVCDSFSAPPVTSNCRLTSTYPNEERIIIPLGETTLRWQGEDRECTVYLDTTISDSDSSYYEMVAMSGNPAAGTTTLHISANRLDSIDLRYQPSPLDTGPSQSVILLPAVNYFSSRVVNEFAYDFPYPYTFLLNPPTVGGSTVHVDGYVRTVELNGWRTVLRQPSRVIIDAIG